MDDADHSQSVVSSQPATDLLQQGVIIVSMCLRKLVCHAHNALISQ